MSKPVMLVLLAMIAAAAATGSSPGQDPAQRAARIDALFANLAKPGHPGAAVTVIDGGSIAYSKGFGEAQLEYGIAITPETVFHVASVSKQLTAFAVLLLEQQGKLTFEDDVRQHLPLVPDFGTKITLQHLASHTSGLRDQWESLAMAGWRLDDVITKEHILGFVCRQKELNFAPGTRHFYCNTGYTLLAEVVERVAKKPFGDYVQEAVFAPLGMTRTHFHDDHERVVKNRAYCYKRAGDGWRRSVLSYANAGATSLFTTSEDLARWLHNFASGKVGGESAAARMAQPARLAGDKAYPYGLGVFLGKQHGLATISHAGGDAGFRAMALWFPEKQLGVAVLANFAECSAPSLASRVAAIWLGEAKEPAPARSETPAGQQSPAPVELPADVLDRYVGRWLLDGGMPIRVWREDKKLRIQAIGQPPGTLVPESATDFALPEANARLRFRIGDDGKVTGADIRMGNRRMRAVRAPEITAADLTDYQGTFASDELDVRYELALDGDRLVARQFRHGTIPLTHVAKDRLLGDRWFFRNLRFERDDNGKVNGFRLSGSRALRVWFRKL